MYQHVHMPVANQTSHKETLQDTYLIMRNICLESEHVSRNSIVAWKHVCTHKLVITLLK